MLAPSASFAARYPVNSPETRDHFMSWGFPHKDGVVLVLCGGGMKGLAHIGVFEVLERENIPIAAVILDFLAARSIFADELMVRSASRLRSAKRRGGSGRNNTKTDKK